MKYLLDGLSTERLFFKKADTAHYNEWIVFHADPAASVHWQWDKASPDEECRKWYQKQQWRYENDMGGMNALIEKTTGHFIGHCGLVVQQVDGVRELEIAYSLLPAYWNRGYATEAASLCRDIAFAEQYADSLISIISFTNSASEKVALKLGMLKEKQTIYNDNRVNIFRIYRNHQP